MSSSLLFNVQCLLTTLETKISLRQTSGTLFVHRYAAVHQVQVDCDATHSVHDCNDEQSEFIEGAVAPFTDKIQFLSYSHSITHKLIWKLMQLPSKLRYWSIATSKTRCTNFAIWCMYLKRKKHIEKLESYLRNEFFPSFKKWPFQRIYVENICSYGKINKILTLKSILIVQKKKKTYKYGNYNT